MGKLIDLSGQKFNCLEVICRAPSSSGQTRWHCLCDCGNTTIVHGTHLKRGATKSCGCLGKAKRIILGTTHNGSKDKLYRVWNSMRDRCYRITDPSYKRYGGRGIRVSEKWKISFSDFRDWATGNGYEEGLTIDRINNDGNYEAENCRWISKVEQSRNRSDNKLTHRSVGFIKRYLRDTNMTHSDIGRLFGVARVTISGIASGRAWVDVKPIGEL